MYSYMNTLIYLLHAVTHHSLIVICLVIGFFLFSLVRKKGRLVAFLLLLPAILNMLSGFKLTHFLLYRYGEDGIAIITTLYHTKNLHNRQPVLAYKTHIKTVEGQEYSTIFRSDDFPIYPPPTMGYWYPKPHTSFPVKYLKNHPGIFIIVSTKK